MMSTSCFCYTTNKYYFLPTLLSASQARKNISKNTADVLIIGFDFTRDEEEILRRISKSFDVLVQFHDKREIDNLPIYMARHFLDEILDVKYKNIIHIDGDTQIYANIDPLIEAPLPSGRIFAAPDPMALLCGGSDRLSKKTTAYLQSIGLSVDAAARYVNSGIFRVARSDLKIVDSEIQSLCKKNVERYVFTEQDAMNLAFSNEIDLISMRWNFPAFFSNFNYDCLRAVNIKHFMSNPRPWHGPFLPWGRAGYSPYLDMISNYPELDEFYRPMSKITAARYTVQQHVKKVVEKKTWKTSSILKKIIDFERSAAV